VVEDSNSERMLISGVTKERLTDLGSNRAQTGTLVTSTQFRGGTEHYVYPGGFS